VDFSPNHVNVMSSNFLQQMEIDVLEQLISEDVKVQGQIVRDGFRTCLMVFRIVAGVVAGVIAGFVAGVVAGVVAGGVRAHLNARGTLLPSR
jgi:LytS/YehU family sensor histidine kinase